MNITEEILIEFSESLRQTGKGLRTVEKYTRTLSQYAREHSVEFTTDAYATWLNNTRDRLAPATIALRLAVGKSLCEWANMELGPLGKYRCPPPRQPRPHPLPGGMNAVHDLVASLSGHGRTAVALCGLAGLRINEAATIDRKDYREASGKLVVRGKGEKEREIPVSPKLAAVLADAPAMGRMVPLSNSRLRAIVTTAADQAGIVGHDGDQVSSHDLRATFATAVHRKTGDLLLVQRLLGHADLKTTQVYLGVDESAARDAVTDL
jgi:integrase